MGKSRPSHALSNTTRYCCHEETGRKAPPNLATIRVYLYYCTWYTHGPSRPVRQAWYDFPDCACRCNIVLHGPPPSTALPPPSPRPQGRCLWEGREQRESCSLLLFPVLKRLEITSKRPFGPNSLRPCDRVLRREASNRYRSTCTLWVSCTVHT